MVFSLVYFARLSFSFICIVIIDCVYSGGLVAISVSRFVGLSSFLRFVVSFWWIGGGFVSPLFCILVGRGFAVRCFLVG